MNIIIGMLGFIAFAALCIWLGVMKSDGPDH